MMAWSPKLSLCLSCSGLAGMGINEEGRAVAMRRIKEVFAEVEALLSDGRKYLTGASFTAADLTFAALAAPALGQKYACVRGLQGENTSA